MRSRSLLHEAEDELRNLICCGIECEIAGIEYVDFCLRHIAAGFVTAYTLSGWPDLIVGLGIAAINADAARGVWSAPREEYRAAHSGSTASPS